MKFLKRLVVIPIIPVYILVLIVLYIVFCFIDFGVVILTFLYSGELDPFEFSLSGIIKFINYEVSELIGWSN